MNKIIILIISLFLCHLSIFAIDVISDEEIMINDFRIILYKQYNSFYIKGFKGERSIFKRKLLLEPDYLNNIVIFKTAKFTDIDQIRVKYSYNNTDYYNVFTLTHNEGEDKFIDLMKNGLYSVIGVIDSTSPYEEEEFDAVKQKVYADYKFDIVSEKNDLYCCVYYKGKLKFKNKLYLFKKSEVSVDDAYIKGIRKYLKDVDQRYFDLIITVMHSSNEYNTYIRISCDAKFIDFITKDIP